MNIVQTSLTPRATVVGKPYAFQFSAQGGGTQTWSILAGVLPGGMTLTAGGLLTGTPTLTGDFAFTVRVTDGTRSASQAYTLAVVPELKIAAPPVPLAEVARPFRLEVSATGGKPGYTWSIAAPPSGLTLDAANGVLADIPSVAGSFPLKFTVTDTLGFTDTVELEVVVAAKLAISTKALSAAKVGRRFRPRLAATGGVLPRAGRSSAACCRRSSPDPSHGRALGTPRRAGRTKVVFQVTDALGGTSRATLVFTARR